jgi:uncharacterized protein YjiS (DUF1127 family)
MAYYDQTRPAAGRLFRAVAPFFAGFTAWREARATRAALSRLSDRELADIGLMRADIERLSDQDLIGR